MKLSLIIPTYNRPHDIARLLRNLNLQIRKPDEVIIVDASETSETRLFVENNMDGFAYPVSYYSHEKGLTRQRNFGISKAQYEIIGFTDDDSLFEPDYFLRIIAIFEKDTENKIGGAAGFIVQVDHAKILEIDSRLGKISGKEDFSGLMQAYFAPHLIMQRSKARKWVDRILFLHSDSEGTYCSSKGRFHYLKEPFSGQKAVDFLQGIAFYRKEVFDHVKYSEFFEGYGFGEDVHFSLQVGKRYKLMVDGEAMSYHLHTPSARPDLFRIGYMHARNHFFIFKTYKERNMLNHLVFWYFFCVNAILEFIPALAGKNSLHRINLFLGRMYGGGASILARERA